MERAESDGLRQLSSSSSIFPQTLLFPRPLLILLLFCSLSSSPPHPRLLLLLFLSPSSSPPPPHLPPSFLVLILFSSSSSSSPSPFLVLILFSSSSSSDPHPLLHLILHGRPLFRAHLCTCSSWRVTSSPYTVAVPRRVSPPRVPHGQNMGVWSHHRSHRSEARGV